MRHQVKFHFRPSHKHVCFCFSPLKNSLNACAPSFPMSTRAVQMLDNHPLTSNRGEVIDLVSDNVFCI